MFDISFSSLDNSSENRLICPSPIEEEISAIPLFNNNPFFDSNKKEMEMDTYESFYRKLFNNENDTNRGYLEYEENNNCVNPIFQSKSEVNNRLVFSDVKSEENIINIEIFDNEGKEGKEEKHEKEKIFEIKKEKKTSTKMMIKSHRKKKNKVEINKENKFFPFDEPKGIFEDNTNSVLNSNGLKTICPIKFITSKKSDAGKGSKKLDKKIRKFKCDDINKKIKSRFHKTLKNIINQNLKKAGAQQLFYFIPQCFIEKVSKKFNSQYLSLTYKELLSKDFCSELNKNYYDINYDHNIKVLKYLEENEEISKKSGFDLIKDMTYEELLNKYFNSSQFEDSIFQLKDENESPEYIKEYFKRATNYLNYYRNGKKDNFVIPIDDENSESE